MFYKEDPVLICSIFKCMKIHSVCFRMKTVKTVPRRSQHTHRPPLPGLPGAMVAGWASGKCPGLVSTGSRREVGVRWIGPKTDDVFFLSAGSDHMSH